MGCNNDNTSENEPSELSSMKLELDKTGRLVENNHFWTIITMMKNSRI